MHVHFRELKSYPANRGGERKLTSLILSILTMKGRNCLYGGKDNYVFEKKNLYE